jgi:hypothetical protein
MSCQPDLSSFGPHSRLATGNQSRKYHFIPLDIPLVFLSFQSPLFAPLTGSSPLIYDPQTYFCPPNFGIDPEAAVEPNLLLLF